jgi:hypothetical protein
VRKTPTRVSPIRIQGRRGVSNLLELLDSRVRPGVTETEFRHLFVECACKHIFTRRAYRDHACAKEVIDLTGDEMELTEDVIDLTGSS